ncbi:MAG: sugar phosphate nucleotidyltransferase [Promethearchaeota archaeon]
MNEEIPAIILAAGKGKRLRPYTEKNPKVLIEVQGKTLLEYNLLNLIEVGVKHFIIITGYKADIVENWIQKYILSKKLESLNFKFIHQKNINGTGGAALLAEKYIKDMGFLAFFLIYGDLIVSGSVIKRLFYIYHREKPKYDIYLVGNHTVDPSAGAAIYYKDNTIINLIEKPKPTAPRTDLNNSGIYIFNTIIFDFLKNTNPSIRGEIELTEPIIRIIQKNNQKIRLIKIMKEEFWYDVGTVELLKKLNHDKSWNLKMS